MLEVSQAALTNVTEYLRQQKIDSPIRVTMVSGGCAGAGLSLAVDQATDQDQVFTHEGVVFVVEKSLLAASGGIKVDFVEKKEGGCGCGGSGGFSLTSEKPLSSGTCGCSCDSGACA